MNIDDLLGNTHDDRLMTAAEQIHELERQALKRGLASVGLSSVLIAQIDELNQQIWRMEPEGGMPDMRRRDREPLERERRELQRSLQLEELQKWRDVQLLGQEGRHVRKEATEEQQRYDRLSGALYDARPE